MPTIWSKDNPAWGKRRRIQRNHFAFLVTMAMTNGAMECPSCENPLDLDYAEVDRAIPANDYTPGNVAYICHGCNHGRGLLQSTGNDWPRVAEYIARVQNASVGIPIPTEAEAERWWKVRPVVETHSRYA